MHFSHQKLSYCLYTPKSELALIINVQNIAIGRLYFYNIFLFLSLKFHFL